MLISHPCSHHITQALNAFLFAAASSRRASWLPSAAILMRWCTTAWKRWLGLRWDVPKLEAHRQEHVHQKIEELKAAL